MIKLSTLNEETLKIDEIKQLFVTTLNSHAPMKATNFVTRELQKQPPKGVLKKRCSEIMQQIYRRRPMPKCDFNKVALQLY